MVACERGMKEEIRRKHPLIQSKEEFDFSKLDIAFMLSNRPRMGPVLSDEPIQLERIRQGERKSNADEDPTGKPCWAGGELSSAVTKAEYGDEKR